jgi:hypothetical protein
MAADSTIFYPGWPIFELADIDAVTYEVSGFEAYHLFDGRLTTRFAKISSQDPVNIDLDLNKTDLPSATYAFGMFIFNYTVDHSNSDTSEFQVYHSDDGSTWGTAIIDENITDSGEPIHLFEIASAVALKRYLRFTLSTFNSTMYVGQILAGRKITVAAGPEIESTETIEYFNTTPAGSGPRSGQHATAVMRDGVKTYSRSYVGTSTVTDDIELLYEWARGGRAPLVAVDSLNGTEGTPHIVRLGNRYAPVPLASGVYKVPLVMQDLPYFTDGYIY